MQRMDQEAREKLFNHICQHAIDGKRRLLSELLIKNKITIAFTVRECTSIRYLAMHGHVAAVDFLIQRFDANPFEALLGYVLSDNEIEAQKLVEEGERFLSYVYSLARAGNLRAILNLGNQLEKNNIKTIIVTGLAMGGHVDKVRELPFATAYHLIGSYIYGLAFSKQTEELNEELAFGGDECMAIWGCASAGDYHMVDKLLDKIKENTPTDYTRARNYAAMAYAACGYVELSEDMINRGASITWCICGFASAGMKYKVDELLEAGAAIDEAIKGYLKAYSVKEAVQLYEAGGNSFSVTRNDKEATWGEYNNEFVLNIFSHLTKSNKEFDLYLAYLQTNRDKTSYDLLFASGRLNTLMQTYKLDYHAAKCALSINAQPRFKTWLLQGIQISEDRNQGLPVLSFDIYLHITSLVINLPIAEVIKIFNMVNDFLLIDVVRNQSKSQRAISTIFSMFGQHTYEQRAGIRHQERRLAWK